MIQFEVEGQLAQVANVTFEAGDSCWGSKGSLVCLPPELKWKLKVPGGLEGAARRVMSGESITLMFIESKEGGETAILSANQPGKIIEWDLEKDGPVITTRGSFVAAFGPNIQIDVSIAKRLGAAFFGGAGVFMQKISGQGTVLIHGAGDFSERQLAEGEAILVSTGNLAAFASHVDYNIQTVGDVKRVLFGGEGLFMTRLTGPGRVLLQTLKRSVGQAIR